ncbi:MAG TPA: hypothetical protein VHX42_04660 [Candidatus Babeliales bacterium]|jgi:hypothetical protein|nr:hypothetical protein [Candidatus Babeliales bacterium]
MYKKIIISLCLPISLYGTVAYMPQALKECVSAVYDINGQINNAQNLEELYGMMRENRVLASDDIVRAAIKEAYGILGASNVRDSKAIKSYLQNYANSLDNTSLLLAMQGDKSQQVSWSASLVTQSLKDSLITRDMIYLSNELAGAHNISLCGNVELDQFVPSFVREQYSDSNGRYPSNLPAIMFGTGVASPVVNAWRMAPSDAMQSPVTMRFSIPGHLHPKKTVILELHFFSKQHAAPNGTARLRVEGMYMGLDADGDRVLSESLFSVDSNDFLVTEQLGTTNSLRHICVQVKLEKAMMKGFNTAFLSLMRVAPRTGAEYAEDLYLAASVLRYAVQ